MPYDSLMRNIFVYGSLMFDRVWCSVVTNYYPKFDARLDGYVRLRVKGEDYPGLIEFGGATVAGKVLLGIERADIEQLDQFEGAYYQRKNVTVRLNGNRVAQAETYVFRDEYRFLLSDKAWCAQEFREKGLVNFLARYQGFRHIHGR